MTVPIEEQVKDQRRAFAGPVASKVGAVLAIVGGLGYFVGLLLHGDLPDQTTEIALSHIAARPEWTVLKLSLTASVVCWIGAFVALASILRGGLSGLLSNWASSIAVVGLALVTVEYSIIGHALKNVADDWAMSPTDEHVQMAAMMLSISGGLFHSFVAWMFGLPFVLAGAAIVSGDRFPSWFGWSAILPGCGAFVAGVTRFLGIEFVPYPLLYGGFVLPLALWMVALGAMMSRAKDA
jgi:hypothetical protein